MSTRTTARHRKATRALTPLDDLAPTARRGFAVAASSGLALTMIASGASAAAAGAATEVGASAGSLEASGVGALAADARAAVTTNAAVAVDQDAQWTVEAAPEVQAVAPVVEAAPVLAEAAPVQEAAPAQDAIADVQAETETQATPAQAPAAPVQEAAPAPAAPSSAANSSVVAIAMQYVGTPYVWGGSSPSGFDCSGFTSYVYAQVGINLPRTSGAQAAAGYQVSAAEAQPGDLLVWPGHVAIYAGDGMLVEAGNESTGVVYREIWGSPSYVRVG
ncbi:MAG: C40 family peptidase [Actinomyces bowdenii]|nr:C40 family peptidase [Actinomyces bowdenii]